MLHLGHLDEADTRILTCEVWAPNSNKLWQYQCDIYVKKYYNALQDKAHTNKVSFPKRTVVRNIAPSMDKSCSSGLNGSDPEQMSEQQRMKTFPECHKHLE